MRKRSSYVSVNANTMLKTDDCFSTTPKVPYEADQTHRHTVRHTKSQQRGGQTDKQAGRRIGRHTQASTRTKPTGIQSGRQARIETYRQADRYA